MAIEEIEEPFPVKVTARSQAHEDPVTRLARDSQVQKLDWSGFTLGSHELGNVFLNEVTAAGSNHNATSIGISQTQYAFVVLVLGAVKWL